MGRHGVIYFLWRSTNSGAQAPSHGSLTQRDRDPPFKRSDPGAIPGRPTNFARHAQVRCARLVSGRGGVELISWAPLLFNNRVVLWEETGLQNRSARFDSLTARQIIQVWVAGIPAAL